MKRIIARALSLLVICVAGSFGQSKIINFFPHADSLSRFPPFEAGLEILCQKQISERYISFVGLKGDKKVLLVAVTLKPLRDVDSSISLTVDFDGTNPKAGKVTTWGYVFDRNGDGKIDYLTLLGGAAPFKGPDFPDNYPLRKQALNYDQLELFVNRCRLVFNHWADDNYDDTLDAVIHIDLDPQRDWVERRIVVRSSKSGNWFDDVWAFHENIDEEHEAVSRTKTSVTYHPLGGKPTDVIDKAAFMDKTRIMQLINLAAKECKLTKEQFAR